ncbi:MAG: HupE/UreJ family protein [Bacteroidota bacterium]
MEQFWFYLELGLNHVLDPNAYDHILFLVALAIPFSFKEWKSVLVLATIFTVAHCLSLALSVYEVFTVDVALIEFLIPVTILLTALFNGVYVKKGTIPSNLYLHGLATAFFGFVHGFGFSNYFKMMMAEEDDKVVPLLGFAAGIEISQVTVILALLALSFVLTRGFKLKPSYVILGLSALVICITIPLLVNTFPI